ncbi:methionyl-tRNA formyltransferase [Lederbergia galactosidilytica]|uniref:Methionyl-tRNA formyltransferase n=1 Tax=Lederbergia galactosidilytica TaxID=217031 RepID=A0A177ZYM5_9BACI|nr:methionyl-tRNA formyltransferase [Lederbergia galactosidilytica]MBP1913703.1 methionyl-tRNA formyltransferase [Lederbergia galactosidilytica]OAK72599.1 methionyl-tRNA formyltransferase [Lederbergia galactosidilytica]
MTRVIFMGTPDFSVPILKKLMDEKYDVIAVVTQPDRPVGRKKKLTAPPVKIEAERLGIPVLQPEKIRDPLEVQKIVDLKPDLLVTAAYGQILPESLLKAPKHGCINVHASLLPELRGGAPIHYALLQGKEKTGITIMYMVKQLDAGDILTQVEVPIEENDDVGSLHNKLSLAGAKLLSETIPDLLAGKINPVPQDHQLATFASNISREQEKINWDESGETIYNQIRGLSPWPVAYTIWSGKTLKIWRAEKVENSTQKLPGTIVSVEKNSFTVSTNNEIGIKILEVQPAGKKKMTTEQFLNGTGSTIKLGDRLGQDNE